MKNILLFWILLLSTNVFGTGWEKLSNSERNNFNCILYLENIFLAGTDFGIVYSTDNFQTAYLQQNELLKKKIIDITRINNYVFAATHNSGIYISYDMGENWSAINSQSLQLDINTMVNLDSALFIGTNSGKVYKSTDSGQSWILTSTGLGNNSINRLYAYNSNLFCLTDNSGVYKYDNGSETWQDLSKNLPAMLPVYDCTFSGENFIICTKSGIFYSTNLDSNWIQAPIFTSNNFTRIKSYNNIVIGGTNTGKVYLSTDYGVSWNVTYINVEQNPTSVIEYFNDRFYLGFIKKGLLRSLNYGLTWDYLFSDCNEFLSSGVRSIVSIDSVLYVGTYGGKVLSSSNYGNTWKDVTSGINCNSVYEIIEAGDYIFVCTNTKLYRSNKNNINWVVVSSNLYNSVFNCIDFDGNAIYCGTKYDGVWKSSNFGQTWENLGLLGENILSIIKYDKYLFVGSASNHIYYSINEGLYWENMHNFEGDVSRMTIFNNHLIAGTYYESSLSYCSIDNFNIWSTRYIQDVLSLISFNDFILIGTRYSGISISRDYGSNLAQINDGFDSFTSICSMGYDDQYFYAGALNGLYRQKLNPDFYFTDIDDNIITNTTPTEYKLNQNYPNPFNPSTTISFSIPKTEFVTLKIYDSVGKEITTLVNENLPAGTYNKQFNATNLSSGVYFYRLQAGSYYQTNKMILVK